ncbi:fungal-specific transcription factor domain-containing protein [Hypoxylon sp. FL1150]|nr:fungal-specific transcription factor domain-containing protein [Hypoxylon sp. FL1150]
MNDHDPSNGADMPPPSGGSLGANGQPKRVRALLSCHACRSSKLKCDRATPCCQCLRKGKPEGCVYAPRPEKRRPAKTMAARLKRLEGMVREMIDTDDAGNVPVAGQKHEQEPGTGAVVVHGPKATSYVGGTHFMAMLEDIEDLKSYFEDSTEDGDETHDPYENTGPAELLMFSRGVPRDKRELLAVLPEKVICDRLMNRYFNSNSPSQHVVHVPTFLQEYNEFIKNPYEAPLHWIALLYMVLALGIFFSAYHAPHELEGDSPVPAMDRFKQFRGAAGWALIWGKYSQPDLNTLQAFLLYVEGDFMSNRENRMNCYLLSSIMIRLMLKMGLHRDPSKLPNISPYEGEMRRRMWNLAIQLDLLVAFNLGLPSMMNGIESDTNFATHLLDTDFSKDTKELPPPRPNTDYTPLIYPIYKSKLIRGFFHVVKQAHSLTPPAYADVMKIDEQIDETWKSVPTFMQMKPIEECVMDPTIQVIQRFGLASIYQKSRCVLHRRYLVEVVPQMEHDYSRRACLDAALSLLSYQETMHEACKPGGLLNQGTWFVAALVAVHDFLLADMVVALVVQTDKFWEVGSEFNWIARGGLSISRGELLRRIKKSHTTWSELASGAPEFKKAAQVVGTMLHKIQARLGIEIDDFKLSVASTSSNGGDTGSMANLTIDSSNPSTGSPNNMEPTPGNFAEFGLMDANLTTMPDGTAQVVSDPSWMMQNGTDWSYFEAITCGSDGFQPAEQMTQDAWLDEKAMDEFSAFVASNSWDFAPF